MAFDSGYITQADRFLVRKRDVHDVQNPAEVPIEVLDIDLGHGSIIGRGAMNSRPLATNARRFVESPQND